MIWMWLVMLSTTIHGWYGLGLSPFFGMFTISYSVYDVRHVNYIAIERADQAHGLI